MTLPASWEACMRVKKQQLELEMEKWTGSKLGKEYIKAVYYHPAYLTQSEVKWSEVKWNCLVMSDSLRSHGLHSPWNSPGQNTGVGSLSLLQGIFPTHGSNPGLLHWRQILYQLSHKGSPRILEWVACPFSSGSSWPRNQTRVSCIAGWFFTNWAMREGLYAEYIMWNAGLDEAQDGSKIAGRNINNFKYADDTTLLAESEKELKSLLIKRLSSFTLIKVKEERKKLA